MALQVRPGILDITPYVGGKDKAGANSAQQVHKLSANEAALGPSPHAIDAYRAAAARLHRYPDGNCIALRAAIGRRFALDPARVMCGAGSDEIIALLVRAFAGPGDEVLHSAHGFLMYRLAALGAGAHVVAAPERALTSDVDALLARVTSRTRLVFLANPNNPTGSYLPRAELERLQRGLPDHVLLVIDGAYAEYVDAPDYSDGRDLVDGCANVAMTRTFSKIYGLGALRLGWCYAQPFVVDVLNRLRGPFNVASAAQEAGIAALADSAHEHANKAHNARWRAWLDDELTALGLTVYPSAGNFLLVRFPDAPEAAPHALPDALPHAADGELAVRSRPQAIQARDATHAIQARDAKSAERFLEGEGVLVRAMAGYGLPDCLRITVGDEAGNRAVIAALQRFMA